MPSKTASLDKDDFKENLKRNRDGTGIMFVQDGKVQVLRELVEEREIGLFTRGTKRLYDDNIKELFIHSRHKTHGLINIDQVHPYKVLDLEKDGNDLYCMHNGVINVPETKKNQSDTYNFLTFYVRPLLLNRVELLQDHFFQEVLTKFIGTGNKLVFLDDKGVSTFINKDMGTEWKGCWLSNTYSISNSSPSKVKSFIMRDDDEDYAYWYSANYKTSGVGNKQSTFHKQAETEEKTGNRTQTNSNVVKLNDKQEFKDMVKDSYLTIVIEGLKTLSPQELYQFILDEPEITTDVLEALLLSNNISIAA